MVKQSPICIGVASSLPVDCESVDFFLPLGWSALTMMKDIWRLMEASSNTMPCELLIDREASLLR